MNNPQQELWENLKSTNSLSEIQTYIEKVIDLRGVSTTKPELMMLLLTEEVGELAKAVRKDLTSIPVDQDKLKNYDSVENELADVFIVLTSFCNVLGVDLFEAVKNKEAANIKRHWKN